jgi:PAS domain S-box-containing protein
MTLTAERRRRTGDRLAVGLLTFGLVFLLASSAWWVSTELARARELSEEIHANYQQLIEIQRAFSLVQDAETATRGYALTGREEFLTPYTRAEAALPAEGARLEKLYASEPEHLAEVKVFERLAAERLAVLAHTIETRRIEGLAGVERNTQRNQGQGPGRILMSKVRAVVTKMERDEEGEIQSALRRDRVRTTRTELIVVTLFGSLILGAAAAILLALRYLAARQNLVLTAEAEARRQRALIDAAMDGIVVLNSEGRIERSNPAAARIFQVAPTALEGAAFADFVDAESLDAMEARRRAGDNAVRLETTGRRPDASRFTAELSLVGAGDDGRRAMVFIRDISARRELERMKEEFISTVSHELRTPLTSIAGSLGLIAGEAAGPLPEKAMRLVAIAQANSQRLVRLINDVLDLEKLESGKLPFHMQSLDLSEIANRAIDGARGYADQLGVHLRLALAEPAPVRGDPDRLVQVVTNLLSNAAKYSPHGGVVTVVVTREGEQAVLTVSDRGPGVPEEFRDRIFSRFAQADSSEARGKSGTGLGLYIAKEIAERHGGRLWFESPPEGGAVFHLGLPLQTDVSAPGLRDEVLLVEDEPAAAALLTTILESEGLKVEAAGTLKAARAALADAGRFGAMVLDLRLPDGDGLDLAREVRSKPETRGIPIIVVSADAARGADPAVRMLDVADWMEKPVDPDRLAELVRRAIGPLGDGAPRILHVDDDRDIRELVAQALATVGEVISVDGLVQARAALRERRPDVVVLDLELRDGSGLDLMEDLNSSPGPAVPVIVFSAQDAGDLGASVAAVLVKSKTSLTGLAGAVRDLVHQTGTAAE